MLDGNDLRGSDLVHLGELHNLRQLSLSGADIRTDDVAWLASMQDLSSLWLCDTSVDDAIVPILGHCKELRLAALVRTRVTAEGASKLGQLLPKAIISAGGESNDETVTLPSVR